MLGALHEAFVTAATAGKKFRDVRSLATHPASTTHRQMSPEERLHSGVSEDTVRLCVGIEHIDDLKDDLNQALAAV